MLLKPGLPGAIEREIEDLDALEEVSLESPGALQALLLIAFSMPFCSSQCMPIYKVLKHKTYRKYRHSVLVPVN